MKAGKQTPAFKKLNGSLTISAKIKWVNTEVFGIKRVVNFYYLQTVMNSEKDRGNGNRLLVGIATTLAYKNTKALQNKFCKAFVILMTRNKYNHFYKKSRSIDINGKRFCQITATIIGSVIFQDIDNKF